jgi:hypothetical protein
MAITFNRHHWSWLCILSSLLSLTYGAQDAPASVNWDPQGNSTVFEDPANWDAATYTPVPSLGNEKAPPGEDSIFFISEGNHTVILSNERSGANNTEKLGSFTIGHGTFAPGTPDEVTGPGD